jgi:hypothetical protein
MRIYISDVTALFLAFLRLSQALPVTQDKRDADFNELYGLTHNLIDRSGRRGDPGEKYFHEATFDAHYDGRFGTRTLPERERHAALTLLLRAYLSTMSSLGAETWIMHGSLLGWYWNQAILPWDSDVDVMVSHSSMHFLAMYHNMTVHHYKAGDREDKKEKGKSYLLEINPHWTNGDPHDRENVIDARWIDTATGLFIDITTLRRDTDAEAVGLPGRMMVKDRHHYLHDEIFPLRESKYEGVPVKVPYAYQALLAEEYGPRSLTKTTFEGHHFDQESMKWVPLSALDDKQDGRRVMQEVAGAEFRQYRNGAPQRGAKPHRLSGVPGKEREGSTGMRPGRIGDVHVVPGNSNEQDYHLR